MWDSTASILQLFEQVLELIRNDKLQKRFLQFATKTDFQTIFKIYNNIVQKDNLHNARQERLDAKRLSGATISKQYRRDLGTLF